MCTKFWYPKACVACVSASEGLDMCRSNRGSECESCLSVYARTQANTGSDLGADSVIDTGTSS